MTTTVIDLDAARARRKTYSYDTEAELAASLRRRMQELMDATNTLLIPSNIVLDAVCELHAFIFGPEWPVKEQPTEAQR